ncbi:MAG TPA: hypothetical protein PLN34_05080 [Alloprevotella sp.]|nr:hypothetical protein [Alloprevotella sp.]
MKVALLLFNRNSRNWDCCPDGMAGTMTMDSGTRMNFFGRLSRMKRVEACGTVTLGSAEERRLYTCLAGQVFDEVETELEEK